MAIKYYILYGVTAGVFLLGGIASILPTLYSFYRKRIGTSIATGIQCLILFLTYLMLLFDWNPHQRKDGVEIYGWRDAVHIAIMLLQSYIVALSVWLDPTDAVSIFGAVFVAGMSLVAANFTVVKYAWIGYACYCGLRLFTLLFTVGTAHRTGWRGLGVLAASMILVIGIPLVQFTSWSMLAVFSDNDDHFVSEILYAAVNVASVAAVGVLGFVFYSQFTVDYTKALYSPTMAMDTADRADKMVDASAEFITAGGDEEL